MSLRLDGKLELTITLYNLKKSKFHARIGAYNCFVYLECEYFKIIRSAATNIEQKLQECLL